jgi:ABC-2 type transport system permease protein
MGNILAIMKKEFLTYFRSPIGYVVIVIFLIFSGYLFYSETTLFSYECMRSEQYMQYMENESIPMNMNVYVISPFFMSMGFLFIFIIPLLTMRLYSEEKKTGTIEFLLTSPVKHFQIIMGKFFGALLMLVVMLGLSLLYLLFLEWIGTPEWSSIGTAYLGLFLCGATFLALGIFVSSTTENQIISGFITFGLFLMLWIIQWAAEFSSSTNGSVISYLSVLTHMKTFVMGIIDTRDIIYYLTMIIFGLFMTNHSLESFRGKK